MLAHTATTPSSQGVIISVDTHAAMANPTSTSTSASMPLRYATWISDVELAFYSSLASIKINHDKLDSSARKVLGLYEINPKDADARSTRMQIHGNALTTDE